MHRSDRDAFKKELSLPEKQLRIARELDRLRAEVEPAAVELPTDVRKILSWIHAHLFDPDLSVAKIRTRCRIRNNNASTRFRLVLGLGVREYIEALRLDLARQFLKENRVEIYLVAMAVGYACQETFCRAFQRRFGHTASRCH
jgi:transcriptional regulator GlxA family with amidase domain